VENIPLKQKETKSKGSWSQLIHLMADFHYVLWFNERLVQLNLVNWNLQEKQQLEIAVAKFE